MGGGDALTSRKTRVFRENLSYEKMEKYPGVEPYLQGNLEGRVRGVRPRLELQRGRVYPRRRVDDTGMITMFLMRHVL